MVITGTEQEKQRKLEELFKQPCLAEQVAEEYRKQHHLPPGTPVPVWVVCRCPRCTLMW